MAKALYCEKEGDSYYSKNNLTTLDGYQKVLQLSKEHIFHPKQTVFTNRNDTVTIADYGSGDGSAFLSILPDISLLLHKQKQIRVILIDSKENDYKTVIKNITEYEKQAQSYNRKDRKSHIDGSEKETETSTYFSIVCNDFFKQVIPDKSLTVGFCIKAMHWLSKKPLWMNELFCDLVQDDDIKQQYSSQGEKDWEDFLLRRSTELEAGGYFFILLFGINKEGGYNNFIKLISDQWKLLVTDGIVSQYEMEQASLAQIERTESQVLKPFMNADSVVRTSGIELVHHEEIFLENSALNKILNDEYTENRAEVYSTKVSTNYVCFPFCILYLRGDQFRCV